MSDFLRHLILQRHRKACRLTTGVFNGSLGTVVGFAFQGQTDRSCNETPGVFVRMDKDPGMSLSQRDKGVIPFVPTPDTSTKIEEHYIRWQLPLALAHAITVHKAQGITAPGDVVVQPSEKTPYAPGLEYVACSRCTRLSRLHLLRPLQDKHFQSHPAVRAQIKEEYARLETLLVCPPALDTSPVA